MAPNSCGAAAQQVAPEPWSSKRLAHASASRQTHVFGVALVPSLRQTLELVRLQRAPGGLALQEVLIGQGHGPSQAQVSGDVVPPLVAHGPAGW